MWEGEIVVGIMAIAKKMNYNLEDYLDIIHLHYIPIKCH